jgi:hypothetical protein
MIPSGGRAVAGSNPVSPIEGLEREGGRNHRSRFNLSTQAGEGPRSDLQGFRLSGSSAGEQMGCRALSGWGATHTGRRLRVAASDSHRPRKEWTGAIGQYRDGCWGYGPRCHRGVTHRTDGPERPGAEGVVVRAVRGRPVRARTRSGTRWRSGPVTGLRRQRGRPPDAGS